MQMERRSSQDEQDGGGADRGDDRVAQHALEDSAQDLALAGDAALALEERDPTSR